MSSDIQIPGYEILDELGKGGMATVYLGVQTSLDRKVAIKVMHAALSQQSEEFKQRFLYEGKVLARVNHPNIVSIFDIGEANEILYMAMEYVPGGTLTDRLKQGNLSVDEVIQVCGQVGLALHTVHLEHIVHRDMKPSNVLMRDGVKPMITDFGIARDTDVDSGLTQTGHIVGTMQYMSPEQIRGLHVDHRSDIYALGLMFYRLLTGRLPFVSKSHYDLSRMQCEDPPPPLPPELQEFQPVIDIILAKDPEERFQTALDFCKALQQLEVTDEDYRTELTQATRIYDSSRMPFQDFSGSGSRSFSREHSQDHPSGGSARYSGSHSADSYPSQGTGPHSTGQGSIPGQAPPRKLGWAVKAGLPLVLVIAAVVVYFQMFHTPDMGLSADDQRRMETYMRRAEGYYATLDIDEPPGENAVHYLNLVLELAPEYPQALDLATRIAGEYAVDAGDQLREGNLEVASADIEKGLALVPTDPELIRLRDEIEAVQAERVRLAEIDSTLTLAQQNLARGRLIAPSNDNAFDQFNAVLALDEVNQAALQGLADIETQLVRNVRNLFDAGDLVAASERLDEVEARFPDSESVTALSGEIAEEARLAREQQQVVEFLAAAEAQLGEGKLIEPEDDNALASYTQALTLQPENAEALAGLQTIADLFASDAESALQQGQYQVAVQLADSGLLAVPDDPRLGSTRQQALGQLGAREREIQDLLQRGQQLVQSGDFLPPGENALETFQQVESLDPGNAQAARGLNLLPRNILDEIERAKVNGFLEEASSLAQRAEQTYPTDGRFPQAREELGQLIAQQQRQQRLDDMLRNLASLIDQPMTFEVIDEAAAALAAFRAEFPGNVSANQQVTRLITAINDQARTISEGGNEEIGIQLLDKGLEHFDNNPQLVATRGTLEDQRAQRIAEEQARIAAMTGRLAIDAVPWGEVVQIVDAQGNAQELPSSTSTPLLVPLLEGAYTVSIRQEEGSPPVELAVNVVAQQVQTAQAEFGNMTADQYFERSGW